MSVFTEKWTVSDVLDLVLEQLEEDQQEELVDKLLSKEVLSSIDILKHVSHKDCVQQVQTYDMWLDDLITEGVIDDATIAGLMTFENSNKVAYLLAHGPSPEIASALYNELAYWEKDK